MLLHEGALAPLLGVQVVNVQVSVGSSHQQSGNLLNSGGNKQQPILGRLSQSSYETSSLAFGMAKEEPPPPKKRAQI